MSNQDLSVQLYTVRNALAEDFDGTLEQIVDGELSALQSGRSEAACCRVAVRCCVAGSSTRCSAGSRSSGST